MLLMSLLLIPLIGIFMISAKPSDTRSVGSLKQSKIIELTK